MKCKKCGASLRREQKICMDCGTQTDYWPGGATKEEKPPVEIPWTPIAIIGGGLLVVLILIGLAMHFRIVPPDQVTKKWVDAVSSRCTRDAHQYTTPRFEATVSDRPASVEKSDEYYLFIHDNNAQYSVSEPVYDASGTAQVTVTFTGSGGLTLVNQARLVRQGRKWLIDMVDG